MAGTLRGPPRVGNPLASPLVESGRRVEYTPEQVGNHRANDGVREGVDDSPAGCRWHRDVGEVAIFALPWPPG